ncbi:TRAP transporter substrate-binding protein [Halomonas elongata]|uniref:TRAP transporter substrate-binding protein n=1 Tax=Halomonas elongata (strain ATCC 33173 / DSM 2581 / NBRC 15536 / NCIMB 2198 / 1H9) TaxID=768066 RepID=E1V9E5_HALED|nr:TRAP transporter substrate-binding protein [Halomonas elongata]WBF17554.1 TRAP transporter substrate-binding protein [Halomonas elongata]WPU46393.1 TRAP transporter substrate-binding protein [Halomonas elongata DSM 2581]CBV43817.1 TRAP transporter substrate-binding protein [Halomonas elongata DSM 2581]
MKFAISSLLLVASTLGVCGSAFAETTLRMAHLWPAGSVVNKKIFQDWAKQVEEDSNGQLNVEIYPSQTLSQAGKTYEAAANGIADIAVTLQGYTAGRFPLTEIVQLPGVVSSASQGSCILQTLYDEGDIAEEYSDTRVLFLFTTGPAYLHSQDAEIQKPGDLEGLRIRRPSSVAGEMLSSMGAQPLGMPAPDIYTALQRGVMDGLSFPWEAMTVFRINELVNYHLELPYYAGAIVATMSQSSYDDLSSDMQNVIDKNSGMKWSRVAGRVFDELDRKGREEAVAQGDTIHVVEDPLSDPDWAAPLKQGSRNYLQSLEERGLDDVGDVYEKALALGERCQA